jgi:predicted small secreted protein|tara:strand:+ start:712 stop:879 length:168 start_codon:yes stop_codon:yes gene_type:complete
MKYIMVAVLALALSGCGNTITGFGKDISTVGEKVTKWQNTPSEKEEVNVSKDETK